MTAIRAAKLAREALLTGPPFFRVNGLVREALVSGSGAALPSDIVVRVAALAREALLADASTFRVAAVVREALVSEAEAPPPSDLPCQRLLALPDPWRGRRLLPRKCGKSS